MSIFFWKKKNTEINLNGIVYSLSDSELNITAPVVVGYALNELKVSAKKAFELAIISISLPKAKNAPEEAKRQSENILESARHWQRSNNQSDMLVQAARSVIQNFLKKEDEVISLGTIFLKCVLSMAIVNEEDHDLTEGEYNAIKGLYDGLSQSKIPDDEFARMYEKLANETVANEEGPLDCFNNYAPILNMKNRELIIKCLFMVAASNGNISEGEKQFLGAAASSFKIEVKRFTEILKEAYEDYKNI